MRITLNSLRPASCGPAIPRCNPAAMLALAACIHAGLAAAASIEAPAAPGGESTLPRLIAEALRNNPEIRAARHERDASVQRVSPAGALDDPMIEAGVVNVPTRSFSFSREDMTMKMLG